MRTFASVLLVLVAACGSPPGQEPLFARLDPDHTRITFANTLREDPSFNILNYLYYYDGGGVAAGDVNGDGLVDLYFTANEGPNRLYVNRGGMRFEDVTEAAGVSGEGNWTTGVTMADVDGDGWLDLYVSVVGGFLDRTGRNQLFINDGDGTFTERAEEFGLDFEGFGTHAVFFDYDRDDDLDVYLVNHSTHHEGSYGRASLRQTRHDRAGDRLYRNDPAPGDGHARRFTEVTAEAGLYSGVTGYGLSAVASDLNLDGCVDLYVANDFHENDYLYRNDCDGTFTQVVEEAMPHTSLSSMGSDAADVDDDGRPDVVVLDMLPDREEIRKTSAGADSYELYDFKRKLGYHDQLARNTLQLNRGGMRFSDVGAYAGIEATDWSWAPLLADLDNDGRKDLFVTNGIYRRPNDFDYLRRVASEGMQRSLAQGVTREDLQIVETMPRVPIPNYAYRNGGDLTFTNEAGAWGLDRPGFSSGAAYADLDNDGDLDLVVNNLNEPAEIYENRAADRDERRFLKVVLEGDGANTAGIGAKVMVMHDGRRQLQEVMPTRGYLSSVDPRPHFGLDTLASVDSLVVVWPDQRFQVLRNVRTNQILTLRQSDAAGTYRFRTPAGGETLFTDATEAVGLDLRHRENTFTDYGREPLMPHKLSTEGPALAVGDVNGDGLDDFYLGGAKWEPGSLMVQQPDGRFVPSDGALWRADSLYEDVDAAFFDADGDADPDLFVVSGGNEFWGEAPALRSRLYLNDGAGGFRAALDQLPAIYANGSCVAPADFDGDGDVDLFLGSRSVPWQYGALPASFLLENDGSGRFTDATRTRAPELARAGMVADAAWADFDGDGRLDLALAGEWMPLTVLRQEDGRLVDRTPEAGLDRSHGWWNTVQAVDVDGDGDADLVGGNLGLNGLLTARPDEPMRLYLKDFDGNGTLDQILTTYRHGTSYPVASVEMLLEGIPSLRTGFTDYADFGARRVDELFGDDVLDDAEVREAYTLASSVALNDGGGRFMLHALPAEAQFAPVHAVTAADFDGNGRMDLMLAGNFFGVPPLFGRYDAGMGLLLSGDGRGGFRAVESEQSGLRIRGEVRALRELRRADGSTLILAARNDAPLLALRLRPIPPSLADAR